MNNWSEAEYQTAYANPPAPEDEEDEMGASVDWFQLARQQEPRFMSKIQKSDGCWLWTAGVDKDGYGKFQIGNLKGSSPKQLHVRAHKLMASLQVGRLLDRDTVVRHTCDTPLCVRPDHLVAGTQTENRKDCVDKQRHAKGSTHWAVKISPEDVERIRANPPAKRGDLARMARELNISASAVLDVIKGRTWRTMPAQARGLSKQDYSTPTEFIDAVKRKFGVRAFAYDLAASQENTKADLFFSEKEDSLQQDWSQLSGDLWLNCPYARIEPWAKKSYESSLLRRRAAGNDESPRLFLLIPAAVGSNWWSRWVHKKCRVYFLNGRISFDGINGYPKDCAICLYGAPVGYRVWRWKESAK